MSYSRTVGDLTVTVICKSDPETIYNNYHEQIKEHIINDRYTPVTSMDNLIKNIVLYFDCDDNYGEYEEETGCGGYGEEFTLDGCFRYIEESGGYSEFDYYC